MPPISSKKQAEQDEKDLAKLGYAQELLREMGGFSSFAVSFSVISILTGLTQLYGYGLQHGGPLQMTLGWWLVSFFTMFVAVSMAELASAYPTAGALYHWSSFLAGKGMGWFTACFNTLGMFAILAGIDYGLAQLLVGLIGWPAQPLIVAAVYCVLLLSHAILNHRGIKLVAWLNSFSAWYHIAVVLLLVGALMVHGFAQPVSFLLHFDNTSGLPNKYAFLVGLLLAQWTLTGYDASAHVTEETHDPRRNAPWGIFIAVVISVIFGWFMLAAMTLSLPDMKQALGYGDNVFAEVLKLRLGQGLGTTIAGLVLGAMWLCGLAAMTSASRMVYAFARDGGLPYSHLWCKVSKKHRSPHYAIWGLAAFATLLALSVDVYSAVVSVATVALYISYGLPIAARLWLRLGGKRNQAKKDVPGPWNLGRFSTPVAVVAVAWVVTITAIFVLPPNEQAGKVMGGAIVILAVTWFGYARRHFRGPRVHIL